VDKLIDIRGVSMTYMSASAPVHALRQTDLTIDAGEFVSIVGPSGCGKTTLLKLIGGLHRATTGTITINNAVVDGPADNVGFAFQSSVLLPWKTTIENVLLPIRVHRRLVKADYDKAAGLLDLVGLGKFKDRYPNELSGGMQQRASICRALVRDPACLLLDEPFGALDALTRENINVFFNGLWRRTKTTVVLVTHSVQEAVFLSTRILIMSRHPGAIIETINVDLPAERHPALIGTDKFATYAGRIRTYFSETGHE
jgi:NitT/TauT family transport system ATP-binding protein